MADQAETLARNLVSCAVSRTPAGGHINVRIEISEFGLLIEVRDPAGLGQFDGVELAEVSSITLSFGSSCGPGGHIQWAELRVPQPRAATA
ncbi:ATP-binding protein [Nonomuraea sp. NPDC046570]|uniref:ATP-binding protein n=1 Tax=Nonomuraea sp. NPDC046570 TaxID=3155255 RepID=UPI0033FEF760